MPKGRDVDLAQLISSTEKSLRIKPRVTGVKHCPSEPVHEGMSGHPHHVPVRISAVNVGLKLEISCVAGTGDLRKFHVQ
ncbi:MAG: hypothetical protein WB421_13435 [Terriglobales bacterium]